MAETTAKSTVKATVSVHKLEDGNKYATGALLYRGTTDSEPFRIYSNLYDAMTNEVYSKRKALMRTILEIVKDLDKNVKLLIIRCPNRFMGGRKNQKFEHGAESQLKSGLIIDMKRAELDDYTVQDAEELARDAARRESSLVCNL